MKYYEQYVDYVYNVVRMGSEDLDAIYKDYIIKMVGVHGFNSLHGSGLLEGCGVINGRELFALCKKEPLTYPKNYEELKVENEALKKLILRGF